MTNRRLTLSGVLFILLCLPSLVLAQGEAEGGDYYVAGATQNGSEYSGGLEILQYAEEEYYTLSWQFAEPIYGQGVLNGSVLSGSFGTGCTLTSYTVDDNFNLDGVWVSTEDGTLNPETATMVEDNGNVAVFDVEGLNADGSLYTGTMTFTISSDGTTADVVQEIAGSIFTGVAIVQEDVISLVLGDDGCGVSSYVVQDDGSLEGVWAQVGQDGLGTETASPISIDGEHAVSGTNPDGTTYTGTVEIDANNQVHTFNYNLGDATPAVGILRGSTVSVGFGAEECSVASYFIRADGTLVGLWSVVGEDNTGSEVATRTDDITFQEGALLPDVEGSYSVFGSLPGDAEASYDGTLEIIAHDDVYEFLWTFDNGSTSEGVGVQIGNTLMVGYGGESCAVNAYQVSPDALNGVWAVYGSEEIGTETISSDG